MPTETAKVIIVINVTKGIDYKKLELYCDGNWSARIKRVLKLEISFLI